MSLTYTTWTEALAEMLVIPIDDANFISIWPRVIDDAEQRMYRELDLLSTIIRDNSGALTANSRTFNFPQHMIVSESISVFTPVGTLTSRKQLTPVSREFLDAIWGNEASASTPSIPDYYAMITDQQIIVGPSPDAAYRVEVTGTIRPEPLSASNPTTYLSQYLPDMFLAASLVFGYGYMKNFGAVVDDPQAVASWENHYKTLFVSANNEEQRKRYASQAWTAKQPAPLATPARV